MSKSMINPSIVDLLEKTEDRYSLVIASAKRAREIIAGDEKKIEEEFIKPLTTAINEIHQEEVEIEEESKAENYEPEAEVEMNYTEMSLEGEAHE